MTYAELVSETADRLNLTSATALARIGRSVNERYRLVGSAIGLASAQRTEVTASTVIGSRDVTFVGVTKIYSVFLSAPTPRTRLDEIDFTQLRNQDVTPDPPSQYAIRLVDSQSVTIFLSSLPQSVYGFRADAGKALVPLSGVLVPTFPEDYHDILVYGAMATEQMKMEKPDLAKLSEDLAALRLQQLQGYLRRGAV